MKWRDSMTKAERLYEILQHPEMWAGGPAKRAQNLDERYAYDKMEPDLAFVYFSDGSRAGLRPQSKQVWLP